MTDLEQFEREAQKRLEEYLNPELKRARPNVRTERTEGVTVVLAVRRKRLAMDETFTHTADTVSRLQARIEAEKAALAAGYPIIGYVIDYQ